MALQKVYGRSTSTHPETGSSIHRDFDVLGGIGGAVDITETGTTYTVKQRFFCTVGPSGSFSLPVDGNQNVDISLNLFRLNGEQLVRARIEKWQAIVGLVASGTYSASFSTQGVHTDTVSIDTSWADGDYFVMTVEVRQAEIPGDTPDTDLRVNDADTFAEYNIEDPPTVTADLSEIIVESLDGRAILDRFITSDLSDVVVESLNGTAKSKRLVTSDLSEITVESLDGTARSNVVATSDLSTIIIESLDGQAKTLRFVESDLSDVVVESLDGTAKAVGFVTADLSTIIVESLDGRAILDRFITSDLSEIIVESLDGTAVVGTSQVTVVVDLSDIVVESLDGQGSPLSTVVSSGRYNRIGTLRQQRLTSR